MTSSATAVKPKHRKRDLVSLVWPVNTCYSTLIRGVPEGVTLDLVSGTWTFGNQTQSLGCRRHSSGYEGVGHPIGVYDKTKLKHLEAMKQDVEWVKERNRPLSSYD